MPVEIYTTPGIEVAWRQETPLGTITCRKQMDKSPYWPDPHIFYWYEVPLQCAFVYHRGGFDRSVRDMSLSPFTCDGQRHLRVEASFHYNIFLIGESVRVLIYEPWGHFAELSARCHQALQQIQEQGNLIQDRTGCIQAMLLALVAERGLEPTTQQMQELFALTLLQKEVLTTPLWGTMMQGKEQ